MRLRPVLDNPLLRVQLSPWAAMLWVFALIAGAVTADLLLPMNILIPILFAWPVALCAWVKSTRFLWTVIVILSIVIFADYHWGTEPLGLAGYKWIALTNRCLAALMLWIMGGLVHFRIFAQRDIAQYQDALEDRNADLLTLNEELLNREETISRQNEELLATNEELERQTEELRIANQELAERERGLEQLLELSRALTATLTRGDLLEKICEGLATITSGLASAVLLRQGHDLEISCHHGFGPADVKEKFLPFSQTFASVVMSMGQTGYLEDLRLRPELKTPEPKEGEPFRSVLSTPLRTGNQSIGAIEVYAAQPRTWSQTQVALIESLASQASITLKNIELVEAIQQERRRFEAVFRAVPFGLAATDDPEGAVVLVNPAAATMLGVPTDENVAASTPAGMRIRRAIRRDGLPVPEDQLPLARALRGEETANTELELRLPDRDPLSLLFSAAPIYDGAGRIAGGASSFADITPQKKLQHEIDLRRREAEEASLRKTRFLAAVSHDIRTPANAISLMAELIRRSAAHPELAKEIPNLVERLQANTLSLVDLVGDVLDVARFDSGKVELVESEFSLGDVIADECRQVLPLAEEKGIHIFAEPLERPVWLHADRVKLGRVLGNLLGNAIKFTSEGGVTVSASVVPGSDQPVVIRVKDTGVGIPAESLRRIFDEFAQLHNPERDRTKGTGLGLAICKRLIEVMGGTVSVESRLGVGSTFQFTLPGSSLPVQLDDHVGPRGQRVKPSPVHAQDGHPPRLNLTVLLVEDHAATRDGTAAILRQEGATVVEAVDGGSALAALRDGTPDVILLDMMLPDMDGREVLKRLQDDRPPALKGVLALTGDLTRDRLEEVQRLGADGLIGKPIDVEKLLATLEAYQRRKDEG